MAGVIYSLPVPIPTGSHSKLTELLLNLYGGSIAHGEFGSTVNFPAEGPADDALRIAIERTDPDLVVCLGDHFLQWRICAEYGIPYVISQHDTHSLSAHEAASFYGDMERDMLQGAEGVIFANKDHERILSKRFGLTNTTTIFPKPFLYDLEFDPLPKKDKSIVYIGGLVGMKAVDGLCGYKALADVFGLFVEAGWDVHIYAMSDIRVQPDYVATGCKWHGFVDYDHLYQTISQYSAGFVGYEPRSNMTYVLNAIPGKMYDYLGAGIPIVCYHAGVVTEQIVGNGWGVDVTDPAHVPDLPTITDEMRKAETMDAYAPEVSRVMDTALGG